MSESNSVWIDICAGRNGLLLQECTEPYLKMQAPREEAPQMIMFIGGKLKSTALRSFDPFPVENDGQIHLRLVHHDRSSTPVYVADCELHNSPQFVEASAGPVPPYVNQRPLVWSENSYGFDTTILANMVYSKLLAPFTTTICLFADDLGGTRAVANMLVSWIPRSQTAEHQFGSFPRILVIQKQTHPVSERATIPFMEDLARATRNSNVFSGRITRGKVERLLQQHFGTIEVLALPPRIGPNSWSDIRARILTSSQEMHLCRQKAGLAFSAKHFQALFQLACDHFAKSINTPFNFIEASREPNPVPEAMSAHMARYIRKVAPHKLTQFAVPVIASALALDSYPPGMHDFPPSQVFRSLYRKVFRNIQMESHNGDREILSSLQDGVEAEFCKQVSNNLLNGIETMVTHKKTVSQYQADWSTLFSNEDCFFCLAHMPENVLNCRHSFCDPCTIKLGHEDLNDPWTFNIANCPLCFEPNTEKFKLKPYTAGVRCLSLDGGGIRGIICCCMLMHLQTMLQLNMPIQEHFDLVVGTSTGGLVGLGLYCNGWSIGECIERFQTLAQTAFRPRRLSSYLPLNGILLSFIADSRYPSSGINTAVKEAFGKEKTLFQCSGNGTKVAITATRVKDSSTQIFTNYNGSEQRPSTFDYRLIRPGDSRDEPLVWHAGRATSAAPLYFKSFRGYHDGALGGHNNPIMLTDWEQDRIWSRAKKEPDVILSLGTGFKTNRENVQQDQETQSFPARILSRLRNSSIPRLSRSFMVLLEAEKRHREYQNSLKPAALARYHRLTLEFHETEPLLDEVKAIPDLMAHVESYIATNKEVVRDCLNNMIASLFYIDLVKQPIPFTTSCAFLCQVQIHCRLTPAQLALSSLLQQLQDIQAYFCYDNQKSIPCVEPHIYEDIKEGRVYLRRIDLMVSSLDEMLDVKLDDLFHRGPKSISNCPYKVKTLIQDQGLDCVFGHVDHKRRCENEVGDMHKRQRVI